MKRAVDMGPERRTFVVNATHRRQTEHLIAATVSQDRPVPSDELVKTSAPRDQAVARFQVEMVGIPQNDLGPKVLEITLGHGPDGAPRADRHECGGLYDAV